MRVRLLACFLKLNCANIVTMRFIKRLIKGFANLFMMYLYIRLIIVGFSGVSVYLGFTAYRYFAGA